MKTKTIEMKIYFPGYVCVDQKKKKKKNSEKATSTLCCVQYKIIKYLNWQFYSCKGQYANFYMCSFMLIFIHSSTEHFVCLDFESISFVCCSNKDR